MNLGPTTRWYHRAPFVLLLLFVVLGPFALPLLWKSPAFSRPVKILLTVLVVVFTIWLCWNIATQGKKIAEQFAAYSYASR